MATGAGGAGMGIQLGAAIGASMAQRRAGDFNAGILSFNAGLAEERAEDAIVRGREAEMLHRQQTRRVIGAQKASFAGQGVSVNTGSAAEIQAQTAAIGEADALRIRHNAALEAWGYRVGSADTRLQSQITRQTGRQQSTATLLTGASRTATQLYGFGGDLGPTKPTNQDVVTAAMEEGATDAELRRLRRGGR